MSTGFRTKGTFGGDWTVGNYTLLRTSLIDHLRGRSPRLPSIDQRYRHPRRLQTNDCGTERPQSGRTVVMKISARIEAQLIVPSCL